PIPRERSFGLYTAAGLPKPGALALPALSEALAASPAPIGELTVSAGDVPSFRFTSEQARGYGGNAMAGDDVVRWEGDGPGQILVTWPTFGQMRVRATAAGQVTLDLGNLYGLAEVAIDDLTANGAPWPYTLSGAILRFRIVPPQVIECRYRLVADDPALRPVENA
ncbi:MAG: hypothetical protein N2439_00155, partial [Anaerolineae bacterium]|nr:hypothetical protein [Anaerolineae bacterium]